MKSLKQILEQLQALWSRSSTAARAAYIAVVAGCVVLIVAVGVWSSRPQFVPLATDLDPATMGEIISLLDAQKIDYKLNFSGTAVLVPKSKFNQARIQVADVAGQYLAQPEGQSGSSSIWDDPRDHERKDRERQEQQIARMLERLDGIDQATVKIAKPGQAIYLSENKTTTAAVVLTLNPRIVFGRTDAYNVARLVADGVDELDIKNVSVSDNTNRLLYSGGSGELAQVGSHLEYKRSVEAERATNAQLMLTRFLGAGRAIVRVNADIDFTFVKRRDETPDPDSKVPIKEKIQSFEGIGAIRRAIGAAGTSSNVTPPPAPTDNATSQKGEYSEFEYKTGMSIDETTRFGGTVERLTVAATVDLESVKEETGTTIAKEEIEALIKDAVGFDDQRGDKITLVVGKIVGDTPAQQLDPGVPWWQRYERLARSLSLGIAALFAFVIGLLVIRKIRPITVDKSDDESEQRRSELLNELSIKASQNPETVSRILAAWLSDPGRNDTTPADTEDDSLLNATRRAA